MESMIQCINTVINRSMDNKQQPALLDNWIGWLQARIPTMKLDHNIFWLKQAMEGYKSDSSKMEPTITTPEAPDKIPSAKQFFITNYGMPAYWDDKVYESFMKTMESYASLVREEERKKWETACKEQYHLGFEHGTTNMEVFANLRVEQAKEEWEREKASILRTEYAWDTISILENLSDATDILLHQKDYDRHGWEEVEYAWGASKELITSLKILNNGK